MFSQEHGAQAPGNTLNVVSQPPPLGPRKQGAEQVGGRGRTQALWPNMAPGTLGGNRRAELCSINHGGEGLGEGGAGREEGPRINNSLNK